MTESPRKSSLIIALTTIYIVWGSTYLAIRYADETLPPFLMAAVRFLIAGPLFYAWLRVRGVATPTWEEWKASSVIGFFLLVGGNGCVVWAEKTVPSALAALMVSVAPLWMAFFNWVRPRGVRPPLQALLGLFLGFVGLVLLLGNKSLSTEGATPLGLLALIMAPMTWAIGSVYSKQAPLPSSPFMATAIQMITGGGWLLVASLLLKEPSTFVWTDVSLKSFLALIYLIVVGSLAGFTSYVWLLKHTPLSVASTYAYVNPVVAVLLGVFLAGEKLVGNMIGGGFIILISVALITQSSFSQKPTIKI